MAGYLARMPTTPSAQYSLTLRVEIDDRPGMLGRGRGGGRISRPECLLQATQRLTQLVLAEGLAEL